MPRHSFAAFCDEVMPCTQCKNSPVPQMSRACPGGQKSPLLLEQAGDIKTEVALSSILNVPASTPGRYR